MSMRWYTTVIDCHDVAAQATWWAETLGWQVVVRTEQEWLIIPGWVTPEVMGETPWDRVGPGLSFVSVPEGKTIKNRLHLDLAPHLDDDRDGEVARLLERGATPADVGQGSDPHHTVLRDPEGNEFCVLSSRDH